MWSVINLTRCDWHLWRELTKTCVGELSVELWPKHVRHDHQSLWDVTSKITEFCHTIDGWSVSFVITWSQGNQSIETYEEWLWVSRLQTQRKLKNMTLSITELVSSFNLVGIGHKAVYSGYWLLRNVPKWRPAVAECYSKAQNIDMCWADNWWSHIEADILAKSSVDDCRPEALRLRPSASLYNSAYTSVLSWTCHCQW